MDLYYNNQKIGSFPMDPNYTVSVFKKVVKDWLTSQGITNYTIKMIFNNGTALLPIVLDTSQYDDISFQQQKDLLKGGKIYIESFSVKGFTGQKDLDMIIINNLSDKELHEVCLTNKYISNICLDDNFWRKRLETKFSVRDIVNNYDSWKTLYIYYMIKEKYGNWLGDIQQIAHFKPTRVSPGEYYAWLNKFNKYIKPLYNGSRHNNEKLEELEEDLKNYPTLILMLNYYVFGWSMEITTDLAKNGLYLGPPVYRGKGNLLRLKDAIEVWNNNQTSDYIFVSVLRIFGKRDDIMNFFTLIDIPITHQYIDSGYTKNNYQSSMKELFNREVNSPNPLLKLKPPTNLPDIGMGKDTSKIVTQYVPGSIELPGGGEFIVFK